MPKQKLADHERRDFIIMVRFKSKHKAVIQQAASEAKCSSPSAWVRAIVFEKAKYLLDVEGNPRP